MPLIGNSMKPKKTGKSGVNNQVCQPFIQFQKKTCVSRPEEFVNRSKVSQTPTRWIVTSRSCRKS